MYCNVFVVHTVTVDSPAIIHLFLNKTNLFAIQCGKKRSRETPEWPMIQSLYSLHKVYMSPVLLYFVLSSCFSPAVFQRL